MQSFNKASFKTMVGLPKHTYRQTDLKKFYADRKVNIFRMTISRLRLLYPKKVALLRKKS